MTVALKRPRVWSSLLTFISTLAAAFAINAAVEIVPELMRGVPFADAYRPLVGMIFWLALACGVLGKRLLVRLLKFGPIVFNDDHVILPRGAESVGHSQVAYADIMSVNEGGQAPRRHFFIETRRSVFHLPQEIFAEGDGPERLLTELRRRILGLPQGASLIEQTERRRLQAMTAMTVNPIATQALLGVILVFFVNTYLKGALDTSLGLLRWGGNAPLLVRHGEYFRMLAATFLHSNVLHVFINSVVLFYLGTLIERLLGWARLLLIFLLAGGVAMVATVLVDSALLTVGASGAVFGLLGSFAVISWRMKDQLPLGLRQPLRWWVFIFAINAVLSLLFPMIDWVAHVGGFVMGLLTTAVLLGTRRNLPEKPSNPLLVATSLVVVLYAAGLAAAVNYAANSVEPVALAFARAVLRDTHATPITLNNLAWTIATDPQSDDAELAAAAAAVSRAVEVVPTESAYHDTVATVAARLHNYDDAVSAALRATDLSPQNPLHFSQLALFLEQRLTHKGPLLPAGMSTTGLAIHYAAKEGEMVLNVVETTPLRQGGTVYALVNRGAHPLFMLQIKVGPQPVASFRYKPEGGLGLDADEMDVKLAFADSKPTDAKVGTADWQVWPVVELP